jgi:hypothetical protein
LVWLSLFLFICVRHQGQVRSLFRFGFDVLCLAFVVCVCCFVVLFSLFLLKIRGVRRITLLRQGLGFDPPGLGAGFDLILSWLRAKMRIQNITTRIRAGSGPKPLISLGNGQSGTSPGISPGRGATTQIKHRLELSQASAVPCRCPCEVSAHRKPTLCYAIVLPGQKTGFRAVVLPDSCRDSFKICPPVGLGPAGGLIIRLPRLASGRNLTRKPDFRPGSSVA